MARRAVGAVLPRSHYFPVYLESANFRGRRGPNPAEGQRGFRQLSISAALAASGASPSSDAIREQTDIYLRESKKLGHVTPARRTVAGSIPPRWQVFGIRGLLSVDSPALKALKPWTNVSGGFHPQCKRDGGGTSLHFEIAAPIASCRNPHRL